MGILDTPEMKDAEEALRRGLEQAFSQIPGLDPTPILCIHSMGWAEDGKTFSVYIDMPGGITRIFSFCEGEQVYITDHGGM